MSMPFIYHGLLPQLVGPEVHKDRGIYSLMRTFLRIYPQQYSVNSPLIDRFSDSRQLVDDCKCPPPRAIITLRAKL